MSLPPDVLALLKKVTIVPAAVLGVTHANQKLTWLAVLDHDDHVDWHWGETPTDAYLRLVHHL